jgi:hypothetical protein
MVVLAAVAIVGLVVDQRTLTGMPLWAKPLKFSLSVFIYGITLSWLLNQIRRLPRVAWWSGLVVAVFLAIEMVIIYGAAFADTTSHFNVSTPFAAALWATMAASIVVVWAATILVAVLLFRAKLRDRARSFAIRAGLLLAIVGMGLAFLMTGPRPDQLADFHGIAGAHTVGVPDGGPGIPLLGWSTVAGDLRIPHFVGMHAMQLIPLAALLLELGARRFSVLRGVSTRVGILAVLTGLYVGILAVLTAQALAGEPVVSPSAAVLTASVALWVAAAAGIGVLIGRARRTAS